MFEVTRSAGLQMKRMEALSTMVLQQQKVPNVNGSSGGRGPLYIPHGWRQLPAASLADLITAVQQAAAAQRLSLSGWQQMMRMRIRLAKLRAAEERRAESQPSPHNADDGHVLAAAKLTSEVNRWRTDKRHRQRGGRHAMTPGNL